MKQSDIWIVEDNVLFRDCICGLINKTSDLTCSYASSTCEEALVRLASSDPPDVLLLDIGLPGMSGLEGIQKFRTISPSLQIIILTVHDDSDMVFQAICSGAAGYLLKDTPEAKIIEAIHDVLFGGSPITARIARKVLNFLSGDTSPARTMGITPREQDTLALLVQGMTKKEIGDHLLLSHHTIDTHIRNIYTKLQVNNRSKAVAKALKDRLV